MVSVMWEMLNGRGLRVAMLVCVVGHFFGTCPSGGVVSDDD